MADIAMRMVRTALIASFLIGISAGGAQAWQEVDGWLVFCKDGLPFPGANSINSTDVEDGCFLITAVSETANLSLVVVLTEHLGEVRGQLWLGIDGVNALGPAGTATIRLDGDAHKVAAVANAVTDVTDDGGVAFSVIDFQVTSDFVTRLRDGAVFGFQVPLADPQLVLAGDERLDGLAKAWFTAAEMQGWSP